jgi:transposase-like protein
MTCDLTNPIFTDATEARKHLEALRWANGRFCPHCGAQEGTSLVRGRKHRPGLYYCNACKKQFTVTVGTVFERSHIPLNKWVAAFHLMASSKKGVSAHQLHRMLGITYKSAWFMAHRIREAMKDDGSSGPLGGEGQIVEADETYIGPTRHRFTNKKGWKPVKGHSGKWKVLSLVERNGRARSVKIERLNTESIWEILSRNADRKSILMTDEASWFTAPGDQFAGHHTVNHSEKEYARGIWHTNTIEGFFSIFKRGMRGVYQHCGEQHLQRYLHEFDFRYNNRAALGVNDAQRAAIALKGIEGKRLTYRRTRFGTDF